MDLNNKLKATKPTKVLLQNIIETERLITLATKEKFYFEKLVDSDKNTTETNAKGEEYKPIEDKLANVINNLDHLWQSHEVSTKLYEELGGKYDKEKSEEEAI